MYKNYFDKVSDHKEEEYLEDSELLALEDYNKICELIKKVKVVEKDKSVKYYEPEMWYMFFTDHIDAGDKVKFIRA